jgi:hypothetical protein
MNHEVNPIANGQPSDVPTRCHLRQRSRAQSARLPGNLGEPGDGNLGTGTWDGNLGDGNLGTGREPGDGREPETGTWGREPGDGNLGKPGDRRDVPRLFPPNPGTTSQKPPIRRPPPNLLC